MPSLTCKRIFLIVLDSFGIGELPDAAAYGDAGSNTLASISHSPAFRADTLQRLGLFNIEGVDCREGVNAPLAAYGRCVERSKGKDTTTGHWEIAGLVSDHPLPTYPDGFPAEVLDAFTQATGRGVLCNRPYSGTQVILDYGRAHLETGKLIVYTSADSVFQIAAHEDVIPLEELYKMCETARAMLTGDNLVGRVIARPFIGSNGKYTRTENRRDFALQPVGETILDALCGKGMDVVGIGKIEDIFAHRGITTVDHTKNNHDGIESTLRFLKEGRGDFIFTNLVDFDMLYGHRNDVEGYAAALEYFDSRLPELLGAMKDGDFVIITADHGCDPCFPGTDHTREYIPILAFGKDIQPVSVGTRNSFADIGATVYRYLTDEKFGAGESFLNLIRK